MPKSTSTPQVQRKLTAPRRATGALLIEPLLSIVSSIAENISASSDHLACLSIYLRLNYGRAHSYNLKRLPKRFGRRISMSEIANISVAPFCFRTILVSDADGVVMAPGRFREPPNGPAQVGERRLGDGTDGTLTYEKMLLRNFSFGL